MNGLPAFTDRLEFRHWSSSDASIAASLWSDPEVMRFLGGPYSDAEVEERLKREQLNAASHGIEYWPLYLRTEGEFAGCCGLKPCVAESRSYELGFQLLPRFWGKGYAGEAARSAMAFAAEELGAAALFAGHHPDNVASASLLTRLGFTRLGTHFFARTGLQHPWYRLGLVEPVSAVAR
jgi:ribosomal-protein-alanine N-acetyltransferase